MKLVVIDIETTQNPHIKREEIIEFVAIEVNSKFEKIKKISFLINPQFPISFISKKVTGIDDSDLVDKKPIQEVLPQIIEFLSRKIIIAHNAKFDYSVINNACKKCNVGYLENIFIDSLKIARDLFPNEKNSLSALKERFGIIRRDHRAREDVESVIKVLIKLAEEYEKKKGKELINSLESFQIDK